MNNRLTPLHCANSRAIRIFATLMAALILPAQAQLADVTQPGDPIVPTSNNSPGSEGVANAIDNAPTKYLNFDRLNAGFTVTPQAGLTLVQALTLTSANDAQERDPTSYVLSGANDGVNFTVISSGSVPPFASRFAKQTIPFPNQIHYLSYRLIFPTVAGPGGNSMQISEVELLGQHGPGDVTKPGDPIVPTSNNSPGSEGVGNAIDNGPAKYLNFDRLNTGFTVTPSLGFTVVNGITLTSANDAPERDPTSYLLQGSHDGVTLSNIASGAVPPFPSRFYKHTFTFANAHAYLKYRLLFPTVAGPGGNSMQISEAELLGPPRVVSRGFLKFEAFSTGGGNEVALLTNHPSFPDSPVETRYLTAFDTRTVYPDDSHEEYGARISGFFIPPVSGNWVFYLRSDDASQLYLNPNGTDPAGKMLLTQEPNWGNPFSAHFSTPQALIAGKPYYIEALHKEGIGGDYCQVVAKLATDPTPPDSLSPIPGHQLAVLADPAGVNLQINQQPVSQYFFAHSPDLNTDFNGTDGGFTVTTPIAYDGPWVYEPGSGSWRQDGQAAENSHPNTSMLNSPVLKVDVTSRLVLTFTHRYSFEYGGIRWDGGQVRFSRNGGPMTMVPGTAFTQNGYGGNTVAGNSASLLAGQPAFTETSPGYAGGFVTSIADLGVFNAGDTVQIQFLAAADTNTRGPQLPNWQIDSVSVTRHILLYADFNTTNGGFTVTTLIPYDGSWTYDAASGSWQQSSQAADTGSPQTSMLDTPVFEVTASGKLSLTFAHRYSFEFGGTRWDGGQVRVSRNGGPFLPVPDAAFTQNGYGGQSVAVTSRSVLAGQAAFTAESAGFSTGFLTSIADLGTFNAGDTVQIQFLAGGDTNTRGQTPNWQIDSLVVKWTGTTLPVFSADVSATVTNQPIALLAYQWERDCGTGFTTIPGATSPNFTYEPVLADNGCRFRRLTFALGGTAISAPAVLGVFDPAFGVPRLTTIARDTVGAGVLLGIGTPGQLVALEASSDLVNWTRQANVSATASGSIQVGANLTDTSQRFYRLNWTVPLFPPP